MSPFDADNVLAQMARECNGECLAAVAGHKPREYTDITLPIINRYAAKAASIGKTRQHLKYQMAVLNGVIELH